MSAASQSAFSRFLAGLATPRLFMLAAGLLGLDLLIPDVLPFVDEILLAILTLIFARRKADAREPGAAAGPP